MDDLRTIYPDERIDSNVDVAWAAFAADRIANPTSDPITLDEARSMKSAIGYLDAINQST